MFLLSTFLKGVTFALSLLSHLCSLLLIDFLLAPGVYLPRFVYVHQGFFERSAVYTQAAYL